MTAQAPLILDRRLAIQLLHCAQVASPAPIAGAVLGRAGAPDRFVQRPAAVGETVWATVLSNPLAPAVPTAEQLPVAGLLLLISLDTKGVLQLRAWQRESDQAVERVVAIRD